MGAVVAVEYLDTTVAYSDLGPLVVVLDLPDPPILGVHLNLGEWDSILHRTRRVDVSLSYFHDFL